MKILQFIKWPWFKREPEPGVPSYYIQEQNVPHRVRYKIGELNPVSYMIAEAIQAEFNHIEHASGSEAQNALAIIIDKAYTRFMTE